MSEKTKTKNNMKLILLRLGSFAASAAPLLVALIVNRERYFAEPSDSVKLGIGAILVMVFIALKAFGKLRIPGRLAGFGAVFLLSYLLEALLSDLVLLSGMAFLGEGIDYLIFRRLIRLAEEQIQVAKIADATAGQVEELLKKYIGSGRT